MSLRIETRLSLAQKFYLTLVLPLLAISALVTWMTYRGLQSNADELAEALKIQGKANGVLSLLLTQDDASKALLIDPTQLELFSGKKITAYDQHKKLLAELTKEAPSASMRQLLAEITTLDETKLRPIDTHILEKLFEDPEAARALYFTDYEPPRAEYEAKIRELARQGTQVAEFGRVEMTRKNTRSLLQISLALMLGIGVVATTITILSRQVERSEENTKSLLAVLSEGLFFFDRAGNIPAERSQALSKIIPGSADVTTLVDFVTKYSTVSESSVKTCIDLLWSSGADDFLSDFDSSVSFLPSSILIDGTRTISLEYRALNNSNNRLEKVVVVASDVTERLKNEREAIIQAERVRKISRAASNFDSYLSFFEEAVGIFRRADALMSGGPLKEAGLIQVKRDLHTLKGSIGTFDFTSLATEIHNLESQIEEEGASSPKVALSWERIKDQWKFETSDIETVLGLKESQSKMSISKTKFERLREYARSAKNDALFDLVEDTVRVPLKEAFSKYEIYIENLVARRPEKQVKLAYTSDSSQVTHAEIQRLDAVFVHLMRNCLDHGIEDVEARANARKALAGTIQLACYRKTDQTLHFILRDDGQGVNGDKLAEKAVKSGIWTTEKGAGASYQEKTELVFVPNLSGKDEVTEISGRGVGMDAVKAALQEIGGSISIYSQPGNGTQFEFDVPLGQQKTGARTA